MTGESVLVRAGYREAASVVRQRARNFFYAFLGQPAPERRALYAVYAFCREADDAVDDGHPPESARATLAELRARLDHVYSPESGNAIRVRDLALRDAVRRYGIARKDFQSLLSGLERDLGAEPFATFDELYPYCFHVAASVGLLCLPIFGRSDPLARRHAVDLGIGMQLTNILRDLGEDARRGRVYLPQSDLERHGLGPEVLRSVPDGATRVRLDELIRFECTRAERYLQSGRLLPPLLAPRQRFCPAALLELYGALLDRIRAFGAGVLETHVSLTPGRKAWLAMRTFWGSPRVGARTTPTTGGPTAGA